MTWTATYTLPPAKLLVGVALFVGQRISRAAESAGGDPAKRQSRLRDRNRSVREIAISIGNKLNRFGPEEWGLTRVKPQIVTDIPDNGYCPAVLFDSQYQTVELSPYEAIKRPKSAHRRVHKRIRWCLFRNCAGIVTAGGVVPTIESQEGEKKAG